MEDSEIIRLYWERSGDAIAATAGKYGGYCRAIARNILGSEEDAEECVNDAWLKLWNAIPPQRPARLSAFLGRVVRNLALDRFQRARAEKRGGGLEPVLEELSDCVSGGESVEQAIDRAELLAAINGFLGSLPKQKRDLFVLRYWYARPIGDIAAQQNMSVGSVTMSLKRSREKLKAYLTERGFEL